MEENGWTHESISVFTYPARDFFWLKINHIKCLPKNNSYKVSFRPWFHFFNHPLCLPFLVTFPICFSHLNFSLWSDRKHSMFNIRIKDDKNKNKKWNSMKQWMKVRKLKTCIFCFFSSAWARLTISATLRNLLRGFLTNLTADLHLLKASMSRFLFSNTKSFK